LFGRASEKYSIVNFKGITFHGSKYPPFPGKKHGNISASQEPPLHHNPGRKLSGCHTPSLSHVYDITFGGPTVFGGFVYDANTACRETGDRSPSRLL